MVRSQKNLLTYAALGFGGYWLWTHRQTTPAAVSTSTDATAVTPVTTPTVSAPVAPIILPTVSANAPSPYTLSQTGTGLPSQTVYNPYGSVLTSNFSTPQTGPVATCMSHKPNWNQSQCEQRLAALVAAFAQDKIGLAASASEAAPYAAPMATAQAIVANPATPADLRAKYQAWITGANSDLADIAQRRARWQAAYDGHRTEYHNLTGVWL